MKYCIPLLFLFILSCGGEDPAAQEQTEVLRLEAQNELMEAEAAAVDATAEALENTLDSLDALLPPEEN